MSAPWYEVHLPDEHVHQISEGDDRMSWAYLMWCIASGPMMNRKRIWGIAEQLERKADEIGI